MLFLRRRKVSLGQRLPLQRSLLFSLFHAAEHPFLFVHAEVLEEMALMQASLHDAHVRQRELQDLVDELQTSLAAAEEELKKLKARKPRKEQARDSGDEEVGVECGMFVLHVVLYAVDGQG